MKTKITCTVEFDKKLMEEDWLMQLLHTHIKAMPYMRKMTKRY